MNAIKNCPITLEDIDIAERMFGKDIVTLKGKITRKDLEKRMLEKTLEHEYAKPYSGEEFKINEYVW